ncbi:MAG: hypothetical protein OER88_11660, partial [Planctomycetota bacterium]|nr:hypothetical protein [Planctomycetota bacterium]
FAYRDGLYLIDDIERALQRLEARAFDELARSGLSRRGLPYPFSSLFVILPRKLGSTRREFEARIAVTRAGLAALAAHRRDGSFPAEFALPTDPYTGQPLLYEVREDGTARIEAARPLRDGEDPRDVEIAWELVPPVTR